MRASLGSLTGLGAWTWTHRDADAGQLASVLQNWPPVARDTSSQVVIRHGLDHRGEFFASSGWGSMVLPTFDRFYVQPRGGGIEVTQTVASPFFLLGCVLTLGAYAGAVVGLIAAIHENAGWLIALVAPVFVRVMWFLSSRKQATKSFEQFLGGRPQFDRSPRA